MKTRQAGSGHSLEALKSRWTEERFSIHSNRGGLGAAMEKRRPRLVWLENGSPFTKRVAGWERPCTHNSQTRVDWRTALRGLEARRIGGCHTRSTAKAAWFGGGWPGSRTPPSPFYLPA